MVSVNPSHFNQCNAPNHPLRLHRHWGLLMPTAINPLDKRLEELRLHISKNYIYHSGGYTVVFAQCRGSQKIIGYKFANHLLFRLDEQLLPLVVNFDCCKLSSELVSAVEIIKAATSPMLKP